ncbi:MAG TPA: prepilin-type N-terminal cleavage/methylation domain-containing protein [Candidatus Binatia bacterium]|jgi:prepilin-type N-terminal cleavage/methylation domain-containing protein|nr:prepilin-type N-terminal cleavage/methylation domain-containing protein [Candidatus Binatia bacterium]
MIKLKHQHHLSANNQQGFTIIELMIATAVFAVVLLIATVAVISLTQSYIKGNVQSETQDAASSALTNITQAIQFNTADSVTPVVYDGSTEDNGTVEDGYGFFCIGNDLYFYQLNKEITSSTTHALLDFHSASCPPIPATPTQPATWESDYPGSPYYGYISDLASIIGGDENAQELLAQNLNLEQLSITAPSTTGGQYKVSVTVAYGDIGTATKLPDGSGNSYSCPPAALGGQFCAVSSLTTTITPRIQ